MRPACAGELPDDAGQAGAKGAVQGAASLLRIEVAAVTQRGLREGVSGSMNAQRAGILLGAAATLLLVPHTAQAQVADEVVLNILRECARIDDPTARLACFDNNIRAAGAAPRAAAPAARQAPKGGGAPVASGTPQGFGAESIREVRQQRDTERRQSSGSIRARVTGVTEREPGVYLLTLEGGAQWLFSESTPSNYRAPDRGATVEIERASLGSFLLRFEGQRPVPVRRVQ